MAEVEAVPLQLQWPRSGRSYSRSSGGGGGMRGGGGENLGGRESAEVEERRIGCASSLRAMRYAVSDRCKQQAASK